MSAYIDTSALAKCYVREARSLDVLDWLESRGDASGASICSLTLIEFRCLLARRRRAGEVSGDIETAVMARWRTDLDGGLWQLERLDHADYDTAREMIDRLAGIPLRSLDAIHLAAAHNAACREFATADRQQALAAERLGFTVHPFF